MPIPKHPVTVAFFAYRMWSRLPPAQRRQMIAAARKHGPKIAGAAAASARSVARTRAPGAQRPPGA
jgi:hypothetical protein